MRTFFRLFLLGSLLLTGCPADVLAQSSGSRPAGYREEVVFFTNTVDNIRFSAKLTIPTGKGPFPAVVLLSDMGAQDWDASLGAYRPFAAIADYMTLEGIAVLRFDDRGVGRSGGDNTTATTADRVKDVQAAVNYMRTRSEIDANRVGLLGHGEGGNVALLTAAQALSPAFVITMAASGVVGRELLARQQLSLRRAGEADTTREGYARRQQLAELELRKEAERMRAEGANSAQIQTAIAQQQIRARNAAQKRIEAASRRQLAMFEIIRQMPDNSQAEPIVVNMLRQSNPDLPLERLQTTAGLLLTPWYRSYLDFDPTPELAKVKCPVLLLHGEQDVEVALAANLPPLEKALKANKKVQVRKLPGVNHQFQAPSSDWPLVTGQLQPIISPLALETIRDWIRLQVK
ncbi:alpha/beta fold hydrolase [Hymenobacter sp. BT175]|uniref:alpha/beta hydrolase n=1 Tax=Hymenobacter translucens TaxID=2886507 RepID=UPI001D0EC266|nr:alpha/beta hydrolase [Hymenobacter translucens]MCC2548833.1 alpha/beta fold hydrolase [Hymenobacter translucens]